MFSYTADRTSKQPKQLQLIKSAVCECILETINNSLRPKKTEKSDQKKGETTFQV